METARAKARMLEEGDGKAKEMWERKVEDRDNAIFALEAEKADMLEVCYRPFYPTFLEITNRKSSRSEGRILYLKSMRRLCKKRKSRNAKI